MRSSSEKTSGICPRNKPHLPTMRNNDDDSENDIHRDELGDTDSDDLADDSEELQHSPRRRRKRIKIRKRVRLKGKSSPKKKIRKILEIVAWTLIIIAFIVTLVVLITELDFNEKNRKKRTSHLSTTPAIESSKIHERHLTNTISVCC